MPSVRDPNDAEAFSNFPEKYIVVLEDQVPNTILCFIKVIQSVYLDLKFKTHIFFIFFYMVYDNNTLQIYLRIVLPDKDFKTLKTIYRSLADFFRTPFRYGTGHTFIVHPKMGSI